MDAKEIAAAQEEMGNKASHVVEFMAHLPPLGHAVFNFKKTSGIAENEATGGVIAEEAEQATVFVPEGSGTASNEFYTVVRVCRISWQVLLFAHG
eukprot:SAG11_NODE_20345_length_447_cov_1.209770_1_plen_94_part_01